MTRRTAINLLKYVLAIGLLTYVVYSYWGYKEKVAARIEVGGDATNGSASKPAAGALAVSGNVVSFTPGSSLTIDTVPEEGKTGQQVRFALIEGKTEFNAQAWLYPIKPGTTVKVTEVPPGLAYVWQRHMVDGEAIHLHYLALAFASLSVALILTFIRWYILVRAQELPFTMTNAFRLGLVGLFFSTFLPGSIGGDIIKAAFIAREQSRRTVAVATVIMDRALALWALIWFVALIGVGFWATGMLQAKAESVLKTIVIISGTIVVVTALGWMLLGFLPAYRAERFAGRLDGIARIGHSLAEFWRAVWMYRCKQRSVALAMLIALIGHVGFVLTFFFSAHVLLDSKQEIPTWQTHFLIVPIGMVIQAVPLFPGGAGIGEAGFGGLYALVGSAAAMGVLASLVQRVVTWVLGLTGALVYLRLKSDVPSPAKKTEELATVEG